MPGHRAFCGTVNSYDGGRPWAEKPPGVKYFVAQIELAPTTGTRHMQFFVRFHESIGVKTAQRILGPIFEKCHMEATHASDTDNKTYCTKDRTKDKDGNPLPLPEGDDIGPWEFGDFEALGQGKRSDLEGPCARIQAGEALSAIAESDPIVFVKYHRGLTALRDIRDRPECRPVECYYLWSEESGTGKSYFAHYAFKKPLFSPLVARDGTIWWDGYDPSIYEGILIDDLSVDRKIPLTEMNRILDGYDYHGAVKGGHIWGHWRLVLVTSNWKSAAVYYTEPNRSQAAFARRFENHEYNLKKKPDGSFQDLRTIAIGLGMLPDPNAPPPPPPQTNGQTLPPPTSSGSTSTTEDTVEEVEMETVPETQGSMDDPIEIDS